MSDSSAMKRPSTAPAVLCCLLFVVSSRFSYSQNPNGNLARSVLFAVWPAQKGKTPDTPLLDPIVLLNGTRFQSPPEEADSDAVWSQFEKAYYERGQKYPMLIDGSAEGEATVQESTSISCVSLMAKVSLSQPLPEDHMRIASTSLKGLGIHPDRDHVVTNRDRSAFVEVAATYLKQMGVSNLPASQIKIDDLFSVSLSTDSPNALIGSVTARQKNAIHHLFLLAVEADQKYVADFASYHMATDVLDHTDDVDEDFVEHLDLDGDGFDEIITMYHYYESWDYAIYEKQDGKWKAVYKGGGGGC